MTMSAFLSALALAPILIGGVITLFAAIGLLRLPDHYLRLHCLSAIAVAGAPLIVFGLAIGALAEGGAALAGRLALLGLAMLVAAPITTHLSGAAAYAAGVQPILDPGAKPARREEGS